ncbi:MAG: cation transporter [Caldimonas sp.]
MVLAAVLLIPALALLFTAWQKFGSPTAPEPVVLSLTGLGALAMNLACALMLARFRHHGSSLTRATYLSARNDVLANVAIVVIVVTGLITRAWHSGWPDLVVGLGITLVNANAAKSVWEAARDEHRSARSWRRHAQFGSPATAAIGG